jgi:serine/threonine protein phosphatase 1
MTLTYAIGDIHGSLGKLERLVGRCERDAGGQPLTLVFLGDYIDRGPQSSGVIAFMLGLQARLAGRVVALKGNHEAMLLSIIDGSGAASAPSWFMQGGAATLESYGVQHPRELPPEHVAWLSALRLSFDDGRRFFVHAGVDPQRPLDAQKEADLMWIREPFLSFGGDYGRLVVHGHTPLSSGTPELRSNRLNLDTAAVFGGPLTAAVFDEVRTAPTAFLQAD